MEKSRVLIVDDEPALRFAVRDFLEAKGYEVGEADSYARGLQQIQEFTPDATICDYYLPDKNALELLQKCRELGVKSPMVILTGHGSIDLAVEAMKLGADHFLTKPVALTSLQVVLDRVLENARARRNDEARRLARGQPALDPFVGTSAAIRALADTAMKVAQSSAPVFILGESGAGKGVLARWIHEHGRRSDEPFVSMNCAGLSPAFLESDLFGHEKGAFTGAVAAKDGLLEVAHRGTLFLDEIGDIDLQVQPKLLKVLEEKTFRRLGDVRDRTVDVRLVAATHQDIGRAVAEKRFRADLYFRINALPLAIPPLRERKEDIGPLAEAILRRRNAASGRTLSLSLDALEVLRSYHWPGNIRELHNVLERAEIICEGDRVTGDQLCLDVSLCHQHTRHEPVAAAQPARSTGGGNGAGHEPELELSLAEVERRHIERVVAAQEGNVDRAAKQLGISRSSLYEKLRKFGTPSRI